MKTFVFSLKHFFYILAERIMILSDSISFYNLTHRLVRVHILAFSHCSKNFRANRLTTNSYLSIFHKGKYFNITKTLFNSRCEILLETFRYPLLGCVKLVASHVIRQAVSKSSMLQNQPACSQFRSLVTRRCEFNQPPLLGILRLDFIK